MGPPCYPCRSVSLWRVAILIGFALLPVQAVKAQQPDAATPPAESQMTVSATPLTLVRFRG
jgi:hypothetical protein